MIQMFFYLNIGLKNIYSTDECGKIKEVVNEKRNHIKERRFSV